MITINVSHEGNADGSYDVIIVSNYGKRIDRQRRTHKGKDAVNVAKLKDLADHLEYMSQKFKYNANELELKKV